MLLVCQSKTPIFKLSSFSSIESVICNFISVYSDCHHWTLIDSLLQFRQYYYQLYYWCFLNIYFLSFLFISIPLYEIMNRSENVNTKTVYENSVYIPVIIAFVSFALFLAKWNECIDMLCTLAGHLSISSVIESPL